VLTEDDHLAFLVNVSRNANVLPLPVRHALASSSLLLIGYTFTDVAFRTVLRGLVETVPRTLRRSGIAVLPRAQHAAEEKYVETYLESNGIRVYWGSADDFMHDLLRAHDREFGS